ncbi:MAG: hypothetical protein R8G66_31190 [Cytophagales bacterium]|nr:hypothetical protein [Cytophagales bacterium]
MMRTAISVFMICFCLFRIQAQSTDGYIVLQNQDTLRGSLHISDPYSGYSVALDGKAYRANEVIAFYDDTKDLIYVRKPLASKVDGNPPIIGFYQEVLIGPMRLYRQPENNRQFSFTYFLESDEQPLTELTAQYKGQLSYLLRACDAIQSSIQNMEELSTNELTYLINKYNECMGYQRVKKSNSRRKLQLALAPVIGASTIDASINNAFIEAPLGALGVVERAVYFMPVFGLEFQIRPPLENGFNFNLKYLRRSFKDNYEFPGSIDMLLFETDVEESWTQDVIYGSIQYRFNQSYRSFFVELGVGMAFGKYDSDFIRQQDLNGLLSTADGSISDSQTTLAILPGIGYQWDNLKVGAFFELATNGESLIINESSHLGLQVSYFLLKTK